MCPDFTQPCQGSKSFAKLVSARIREKVNENDGRLIELADQRGWRVNAPRDPERGGGTVAIDMPKFKGSLPGTPAA